MTVRVDLYNNVSIHNTINKTLIPKHYVDGALKDNATVMDPQIRVNVTAAQLNNEVNYFKFNGLCYFLTDVEWVSNQIAVITGHIDVLESYKSYINNLTVLMDRSSNFNPRVADNSVVQSADVVTNVQEFSPPIGKSMDEGMYVLTVSNDGK